MTNEKEGGDILNKQDLVNVCSQKLGITKVLTSRVLECIIDEIEIQLLKGNDVNLSGLGKFSVKPRMSRRHIHPTSGYICEPTLYKKIIFSPTSSLSASVVN